MIARCTRRSREAVRGGPSARTGWLQDHYVILIQVIKLVKFSLRIATWIDYVVTNCRARSRRKMKNEPRHDPPTIPISAWLIKACHEDHRSVFSLRLKVEMDEKDLPQRYRFEAIYAFTRRLNTVLSEFSFTQIRWYLRIICREKNAPCFRALLLFSIKRWLDLFPLNLTIVDATLWDIISPFDDRISWFSWFLKQSIRLHEQVILIHNFTHFPSSKREEGKRA